MGLVARLTGWSPCSGLRKLQERTIDSLREAARPGIDQPERMFGDITVSMLDLGGLPFVLRATNTQFASWDEPLDTARSARPAKGRFADIATPLGSAANEHERVSDRLLVHGSQRIAEVRGGAHLEAKPFPALLVGIPSNLGLVTINPLRGRLRMRAADRPGPVR